MSFPTSRTAAVETLLPPPRKGKRKYAAPHQVDHAWRPLPAEHAIAAERRLAHFKALEVRVRRAAMHVQEKLLEGFTDGDSRDTVPSLLPLAHVQGDIRVVLVPHAGVLEAVAMRCLGDATPVRVPPPPQASTAPGGGGAARASMLASVGSQLLARYPPKDTSDDEESSKALAAGDLSVLLDVIDSRGYEEHMKPIALICPSLNQAVVDVVFSLQEALALSETRITPTHIVLLAVCPTTERWLASPLELRTRVKAVRWVNYATAQQEVDLFLSYLLGIELPEGGLPLDDQEPENKWHRKNANDRQGQKLFPKHEDVRVPLSYAAIQLVGAVAQLAPPDQALTRAAASLVLALQYQYTTEPLTAILPPSGSLSSSGYETDMEATKGMWKFDAYGVALARCIAAQNALEPEETAPQILKDTHQAERDQLMQAGKTLLPPLLDESDDVASKPLQVAESEVAEAQWNLIRYLFHASSVVHPALEHRAGAARMLAGFIERLQASDKRAEDMGLNSELGEREKKQALPILIASLSPSWRSLEPIVLKAKNGVTSATPERVRELLLFIHDRAESLVEEYQGRTRPILACLRQSTGTLPLAHTLESTAKGEVIDTLIRSLAPFIGKDVGPLDGDMAVRQERVLAKIANWVAEFFLNQLQVLSSCVPLVDAWLPSAAAVNFARRRLLPTPRTDVQLALELPELALASSLDSVASAQDADSELVGRLRTFLTQAASARIQPDMAVAYQLMSEQPRLASLADWWDVFAQRVPGPNPNGVWTATGPISRVEEAGGSSPLSMPDEDEDVEWQGEPADPEAAEQAVQARFATALTALHDMGLLAPGARRAEHVARVVFDAPLVNEN